jgi:alkaline phosphatase
MRKTLLAAILVLSLLANLVFAAGTPQSRRDAYSGPCPKYIFYFIGDGFGAAQAEAAEAFVAAENGRIGVETLAMNTLPVCGMTTTYAGNALITDSAAAGTALSTGFKTDRGRIGTASDNSRLETVAEHAHFLGMKVGIVTSVPVDHATPAVFYAHEKDRNLFYEISLDLSASGFEYFAGSGFTSPEGNPDIAKGDKSFNTGQGGVADVHTNQNSMEVARERGYVIAEGREDILKLTRGGKVVATAGLRGGSALKYAIDQKNGDLTLADLTSKGIELLEGDDGFFMMVEGGKIDWACHANDAATTVREVLDFDAAIRLALAFYEKHPDETLIVVTSDHETGGMALGNNKMQYESNVDLLKNQKASYEAFTSITKEFYAEHHSDGDFDAALDLAKEYFGLGDKAQGLELTPEDSLALETAFRDGIKKRASPGPVEKARLYSIYGNYEPFVVACCRILDTKAGIGWTSFAHTASPVPVRAIGCGSELFGGYEDNTDPAKNVFRLLEIRKAQEVR